MSVDLADRGWVVERAWVGMGSRWRYEGKVEEGSGAWRMVRVGLAIQAYQAPIQEVHQPHD
jgi:hypothetical protein